MAAQLTSKAKLWLTGVAAGTVAMVASPREAHPTTCISGPFYVFFEWNDDAVTARARPILNTFVSFRGHCGGGMRIRIVGYADRSGSEGYNMSLSRRRAENVRAYLLGLEIAAEDIAVEAAGETTPLVQTADGVPEAQNRRVEVHYVH